MKNKKPYFLIIRNVTAVAVLVLLLWGCTGPAPCPSLKKGDTAYGWQGGNFMGDWDDYYSCALSYIDGKFYSQALDCLNQAVKQRSADQRMARTYGMHFIDNYFPNRETGVIHFLMGHHRIAEKNLLRSLEQEPSAKAYYYLDEVRKALMKQNPPAGSRPDISIISPSEIHPENDVHKTCAFPVILAGAVSDNRYVSWISIDDTSEFMEGARKTMPFSQALYLGEGRHTINITAGNLLGTTSRKEIELLVDKSGPVISISRITPGKDIAGYLHDPSGIAEFTLNTRHITVSDQDGSFHAPLYPEDTRITLLAEDTLGNTTHQELNRPNRKIELAALNLSGITESTAILALEHQDQPEIKLSKPLSNEIYAKATPLEFTVSSESTIISLDINGKAVLKKPALWITCNTFVPLAQGENRFTITAVTQAGKTIEKTILLTRKTPEHLKLAYRYGIHMHAFDNHETADNWKNFLGSFENNFTVNRRFRLISRNLEAAMAGSPDASYASALFGSVYKTGNGTEVVARLIDKKTSKIITVQDAFSSVSDMTYIGNRLSKKFHRTFPLATGTITATGGFFGSGAFKTAMDKNGSQDSPETRIHSGWPLLVYRGEPGGPTKVIATHCIEGKCSRTLVKSATPGIGDRVIAQ
jgi:hypothetical protein